MAANKEQTSKDTAERAIAFRFYNRLLDEKIFRPDNINDFLASHGALKLLKQIQSGVFQPELLIELNNIAINEKLPPLAHLAGISSLGSLMQNSAAIDFEAEMLTIQNNFATLADRQMNLDPSLFGTRSDARHSTTLLIAALNNIVDVQPVEGELPEARMQLGVVSEILRTKSLQLFIPRVTTVSMDTGESVVLGADLFPNNRMICPRNKLASWNKMEEGAHWGIPIQGETDTEFQLRLPSALVCLEHRRTSSVLNDITRRTSKMDYLRLPSLRMPETDPGSLVGREANDEELVNAKLINGLSYLGSARLIRAIRRHFTERDTSIPEYINRDMLEGKARAILAKMNKPINHIEIRTGETIQIPSIMDRGLTEYVNSSAGEQIDRDTVEKNMLNSLMVLAGEYNAPGGNYRLRSEEDLERIATSQMSRELPFGDLLKLAMTFIRQGEYSVLNVEDAAYVGSPEIQNQINNLNEQFGKDQISTESPDNLIFLQDFVSRILQIRYETIVDKKTISESTAEKIKWE